LKSETGEEKWISATVKDHIDKFVNAWLAVNPKK